VGEPVRQCVACRKRHAKKSLLRVVRIQTQRFQFDPFQKINGRGIYLCPEESCLRRAKDKDLIGQGLKVRTSHALYQQLAEHIHPQEQSHLEMLLGFAARSRKLLLGVDAVVQGVEKGKVRIVVLDARAGSSTQSRLQTLSRDMRIPIHRYGGKVEFDRLVGKPNCRCVGVTDHGFARSIQDAVVQTSTSS
jgi:predicted RNA-binding protein YlxR (DUF448 family)/ribosomal protein L30E